MARGPRVQLRGAIYHVMSRGNRKACIFEDDADRRRFEVLLGEMADRYRLRCQSYCLMPNHYHAVVESADANLSSAMQWLNGVFAQKSNHRHQRTGHLLQGRFKSILVGDDIYLRTVNAYVVLNPVRAGLVAEPSEWRWSSYRATVGLKAAPAWLDLRWLNWVFGGRSTLVAQQRFQEFVGAAGEQSAPADPLVHGDQLLREHVRAEIGETLHHLRLPREYRALARPSLAELFPSRMPKAERNRTILRAHVVHGYRLSEVADCLFVHPNTISRIVRALRQVSG